MNNLHPIFQQALAPFVEPPKTYVRADQVQEGDTLCYGDRTEVVIERVSVARCDGAIGLHGNNETWSTWYQPHHHVRIKRGLSLAHQ
jgi:hypothetical protein